MQLYGILSGLVKASLVIRLYEIKSTKRNSWFKPLNASVALI